MKALALPIRAAVPYPSAKQPSVVLQQLTTSTQQSSGPHSSPRVHATLWLLTHKWVLAQHKHRPGTQRFCSFPKRVQNWAAEEEVLTSAVSPQGNWK